MSELELPLKTTEHVYTVAELTHKVKATLEDEVGRVCVEGEISNLHLQPSSNHCYFTLKDSAAQLQAAFFSGASRARKLGLKDGMMARVSGDITVYPPQGRYQLRVSRIEVGGGVGQLLAELEKLKARLTEEGLFKSERKRPLPLLPQRVGVVTSATGAAVRDILNILRRRFPNLHIMIADTRVQGSGAAAEIAAAVALLNGLPEHERPEVLIVGRGGGSIEDLWAFNEEATVRAVAASQIPVISAVGHETDTTLCDYAADIRAPTPSAAAELVVGCKDAFDEWLRLRQRALHQGFARQLGAHRQRLDLCLRSWTLREPQRLTEPRAQALDNLQLRLARGLEGSGRKTRQQLERAHSRMAVAQARVVPPLREQVARWQRELGRGAVQCLAQTRELLAGHERHLRVLGPQSVLARGYSLTRTADGRVARDAAQLAPGTVVRTQLAKGEFESVVRER